MIRRKSGLQSSLFFPVTTYTLNQAIDLTSVRIRSNLKKMRRPHCNRHLGGKGEKSCVYDCEPSSVSATYKPLSGLMIGGGEVNSHLQVGS